MTYYIVDANVMLTAGKNIATIPDDQLICWKRCIDFIHEIVAKGYNIIVDDGWEILREYGNRKRIDGYPNSAEDFYRYVMTRQPAHLEWEHVEKLAEHVYAPYPDNEMLRSFDPPDRIYIAVAYATDKGAPIAEATDSKWWGIRNELEESDIAVYFLDEDYIRTKFKEKITNKTVKE